MVAPSRSKACRWVGVGTATRSNSPAVSVRTRRVLRVRVARWSSRPEKLRAGRSVVVVLVAALRSAAAERRAGATGSGWSGRSWSVKVSGRQQRAAVAGAVGRQRRFAAGDQAFFREVGVGDLGQVRLVEQAHL